MLRYRGFCAWITCEGRELPLYEPVIDKAKHRITCWLPSEEGKAFSIHWSDEGGEIDTAAYITLDGFKVPGRFLFGKGTATRSGVRTGVDAERPFVFANLDDADAAGSGDPDVDPSQLGLIMLRIRRIRRTGTHDPNKVQEIPNPMKGKQKTFSVRVGFGQEKEAPLQPKTTWSFESYDKANPGSYVTFVFRYRTQDFLDAQGLRLHVDKDLAAASGSRPASAAKRVDGSRANSVPLTPDSSPNRTSAKRTRRAVSGNVSRKSRRTDLTSSASSLSSAQNSQESQGNEVEGANGQDMIYTMGPPTSGDGPSAEDQFLQTFSDPSYSTPI